MSFLGFKKYSEFKAELEQIFLNENLGTLKAYSMATEEPSGWYWLFISVFTAFLNKFYMLAVSDANLAIFNLDAFTNELKQHWVFALSEISMEDSHRGILRNSLKIKFLDGSIRKFIIQKGQRGELVGFDLLASALAKKSR